MAILVMLGWWYVRGWSWLIRDIQDLLARVGSTFAVTVLIKTWFAPWKQITTQSSFRNFFQAAVDNGISRLIGGIIRTGILFLALIVSIIVLFFGIARFLAWAFIPPSIIFMPLLVIAGLSLS